MPAVVAVRLRGLCRVRFDQTDKQPVHRPDALHDDAEGAALAKEPSSPGNIIILWPLAVQLRASVEGADHPRRQAVRRTPRDDMAVHALIDGPPRKPSLGHGDLVLYGNCSVSQKPHFLIPLDGRAHKIYQGHEVVVAHAEAHRERAILQHRPDVCRERPPLSQHESAAALLRGSVDIVDTVQKGQYIQEHQNPLRDCGRPMGPLGPCGTRSKHSTAGLVQTYSRATVSTGVRDLNSHVPFQLFLSAAVDFEKMARVPTCPIRLKNQIFAFIGF